MGGYLFLTRVGVCAWDVICAPLVQVSVPGRLSVPYLCRCVCLGGYLFRTCAGFCSCEIICAPLVQLSTPWLHLVCLYVGSFVCREYHSFLCCLRSSLCPTCTGVCAWMGYLFFTGAGVCAWEDICSSLV